MHTLYCLLETLYILQPRKVVVDCFVINYKKKCFESTWQNTVQIVLIRRQQLKILSKIKKVTVIFFSNNAYGKNPPAFAIY